MVNYEFGKCFCATEDEAVPQSYILQKTRLLQYLLKPYLNTNGRKWKEMPAKNAVFFLGL